MNERDLGGEAGEEERLFHGGVAAADHRDLLAREEEPVAGGAGRNAVTDQGLLVGQTQPSRRCAAGDDQRASQQGLAAQIHLDGLGPKTVVLLAEIDADDMPGPELSAKARCLLAHVVDEFRPLDAFGEAGKVLHQRGEGQLAAGLVAVDDEWLQVGASSIDGGGQPRASGADDDDIANVIGHRSRNRFPGTQEDAEALVPQRSQTTNACITDS